MISLVPVDRDGRGQQGLPCMRRKGNNRRPIQGHTVKRTGWIVNNKEIRQ